MSGGIAQLVAIGAQDAHLVGNPEVSFFRSNYKRHTNFAQTVERQVIQGNVTNNAMSSIRIERKGDMVGYMYLAMSKNGTAVKPSTVSGSYSWSNMITSIQLLVGGQVIDEHDVMFSSNIAPSVLAQNFSKSPNNVLTHGNDLIYPLRFSFCENWQSALPLIALQYHDVEIRIYWGPNASTDAAVIWDAYANFTYLDTAERDDIANRPQNMLITQVQKSIASNGKIQDMSFNQPVKYLCSYNPLGSEALVSVSNKIKLQINGVDVADYKFASPHFTTVPAYYHTSFSGNNDDKIFIFPFCLDTAKLQPTGSLNFSRLDSARLLSDTLTLTKDVYAVNYNILRIQNGMGGLMYAN